MAARIIVIDNDPGMGKMFTRCLNDAGWEAFSYDYDQIGLSSLKQLQPDLILLDFDHQDGGLGWQFLQLVKMEDTTTNIPIIITTTAFHLSAEIRGYLLARYIHVINKPFDLAPFLQLVQLTLTLASQAGIILSGNHGLPILLIEDTEILQETIATVLRFEGYQVVTANNGLLALDAVYNADFGLILSDIGMPIMDGYEFLRAYDRQLRPHIPVIILSAEVDIPSKVLPPFVVDTLPKPFAVSHLLEVVKKYA